MGGGGRGVGRVYMPFTYKTDKPQGNFKSNAPNRVHSSEVVTNRLGSTRIVRPPYRKDRKVGRHDVIRSWHAFIPRVL